MASKSTLQGRVTGQRSNSKGLLLDSPGFTSPDLRSLTVAFFFHPGMVWGGSILGAGGGILESTLNHNSFY